MVLLIYIITHVYHMNVIKHPSFWASLQKVCGTSKSTVSPDVYNGSIKSESANSMASVLHCTHSITVYIKFKIARYMFVWTKALVFSKKNIYIMCGGYYPFESSQTLNMQQMYFCYKITCKMQNIRRESIQTLKCITRMETVITFSGFADF